MSATRKGRGKARKSLELIEAAAKILEQIAPATVRAVCYRLFVAVLIDNMSKNATDNVSRLLVYAREQAMIGWNAIVDETRARWRLKCWADPREVFEAAARQYHYDYWIEQPQRIEIWSEKATIKGMLEPVVCEYGVPLRVMHGHASATAVNSIAELSLDSEKPLTILYIGDWDPSGMHMSQVDLPGRIVRYGGKVAVRRIAIVKGDVGDPDIPTFPASTKTKDARHKWFTANYGEDCVELDAMRPDTLRERVAEAIAEYIDHDAWGHAKRVEQAQREATHKYVAGLPIIFGQA